MSLEFTPGEDGPEIIVGPEEVILFAFDLDPLAEGRFRSGAQKAGMEPTEDMDGTNAR